MKAYKPWAAQVAASPPPTTDPLAPPKKSKKAKQAGGSDELALVAAIKSKVHGYPAFDHVGIANACALSLAKALAGFACMAMKGQG